MTLSMSKSFGATLICLGLMAADCTTGLSAAISAAARFLAHLINQGVAHEVSRGSWVPVAALIHADISATDLV